MARKDKYFKIEDEVITEKSDLEKAQELLDKLETDKLDFDAYKLSVENHLRNKKIEVDAMRSEALALIKSAEELTINLNARKATLDRRERALN